MSAHTPGPWVTIRSGMRDNSAVATIEEKPPEMEEPNYWLVAQANTLRDEWEANARLIAAAPDLLEALEMLLEFPKTGPAITAARAAIAKATGSAAC